MLRSLLITWAVLACAFAIMSWILTGVTVSGGLAGYLWVSLLFGVINAVLGTILRIVTFPLRVLTLGLFTVIINALLLKLTARWSSHLTIDKFWWTAIWAAIILSAVTVLLDLAVGSIVRREPVLR
jgi:putative membrane protein